MIKPLSRLFLFVAIFFAPLVLFAQHNAPLPKNIVLDATTPIVPASNLAVCATAGADGTTNINSSINTYFPPVLNTTLNAGSNTVVLSAVPPADTHGNTFGTVPIKAGDLLLIIQMQDAVIDYSNSALYGSGSAASGPDGLGATGFKDPGNSGRFEYIIATNDVPLTGGTLTFKGSGSSNGTVYSYTNAPATGTRGQRTFQIIRVPQYSNLRLSSNISPPPFNGVAGGVIAFQASGNLDFNGFMVDVSARGFRGGYNPVKTSVANISNLYVTASTDQRASGKGEGIAGTPRYMWDGFNAVDNLIEGLPGGSDGRGAPANAGGGGNDANSGGGGGGNGGSGGVGGWGYEPAGGVNPAGGRPGSASFSSASPDYTRLILGGGGGGGHANDALTGVKGGVGGGIVIINAAIVSGNGTVLANGSAGQPGVYGLHPDGSGGGGAGGTVYINLSNPNPSSTITIKAIGGVGGNTQNDPGGSGVQPHGPGGGGGGGLVFYAISSGTVDVDVSGGASGKSNSGAGTAHNAQGGANGVAQTINARTLPPYLQFGSLICYPELTTILNSVNESTVRQIGDLASYVIKITNSISGGNAGGVKANIVLPQGFNFKAATVSYSGSAGGPVTITNSGSAQQPVLGDFNIPPGGEVDINLDATITCVASGVYSSSAEALYLDPTRDYTAPSRLITPATNAFTGDNATYLNGGTVSGSNFNGNSSTADDITVSNVSVNNNTISTVNTSPLCSTADPGQIQGSTPVGGSGSYTYQWQSSTDNVTFIDISGATLKDYDPGQISAPTYYRREVFSGGGCTVPFVGNVVSFTFLPPLTNNVITQPSVAVFCESGAPGTITGNIPTGGDGNYTYQWQASLDNVNFTSIATATSKDYNNPGIIIATTYYRRIATSASCSSIFSNVVEMQVTTPPLMPVMSQTSINICSGGVAALSVSAPQQGVTYNWYDSATKSNLLFRGSSYTTLPLTTSTTFFIEALNGSCSSSTLATIQVNINPPPAAPVLSQNTFNVCPNSTVSISIVNPNPANTYKWYQVATGGSEFFTGVNYTTSALTSNIVYYVEAVNSNGCVSATRSAVNVNILPQPDFTVSGATICPGTSTTLTATSSDPNTTISWYNSSTGGSAIYSGTNFNTPVLNRLTTYYAEATNLSGCISATRTAVQVSIIQPLAPPVVSVANTTVSSITFAWDAVNGATGYEVSIDNGQTYTRPSSGNNGLTHTVTGLTENQRATILVRANGAEPCQLSGSSTAVTALAVNPLGYIVYVPNAFTPNGDGQNDIVYVHSDNIKTLKLYIYDQWGELLFTSSNLAVGWDGTYRGAAEPVGVYVYYLKAMLNNGREVMRKGTITLIR